MSLIVLAAGIALVQISATHSKNQKSATAEQNHWLGLMAVIISCFTSRFLGIYFEKVLKQKSLLAPQVLVYMRNSQLAMWSILLGLSVIANDWHKNQQHGIFQGYSVIVWTVAIFQALTGLLVGLVIKYADASLKGFATSVAVVLATILSAFVFNAHIDFFFFVGAGLVVFAVLTYTNNPPSIATSNQESKRSGEGSRNHWIYYMLFCITAVMVLQSFSMSSQLTAIAVWEQ